MQKQQDGQLRKPQWLQFLRLGRRYPKQAPDRDPQAEGKIAGLASCPFCGRQPFAIHSRAGYSIRCRNGLCIMPATGIYASLDAAAKVWNRRFFDASPGQIRGYVVNE